LPSLIVVRSHGTRRISNDFTRQQVHSGGISQDGTEKVFIDRDPYRHEDEVGGAVTRLFSVERVDGSGRHYWARRVGFGGHCAANTIYFTRVGSYEDQNGVGQFTDDVANPEALLSEEPVKPKSLGDIVLSAACKR
jgi:hypothetical protein